MLRDWQVLNHSAISVDEQSESQQQFASHRPTVKSQVQGPTSAEGKARLAVKIEMEYQNRVKQTTNLDSS